MFSICWTGYCVFLTPALGTVGQYYDESKTFHGIRGDADRGQRPVRGKYLPTAGWHTYLLRPETQTWTVKTRPTLRKLDGRTVKT